MLEFINPDQLDAFPDPVWLVDGMIVEGSLNELYAPYGMGKSFVALDLAHSIATGLDFLGHSVRRGRVVYVAAGEGVYGLKARKNAWQASRGVKLQRGWMNYVCEAVLLHQEHEMRELKTSLDQMDEPPSLIVFDTLARCSAGTDEKEGKDVGRVIRGLDTLREQFPGLAVLAVHHTGHVNQEGQAPTRSRGHSSWQGALDTSMQLTGVHKDARMNRTLKCMKLKEGPDFPAIKLRLVSQSYGPRASLVTELQEGWS